MMKKLIAFLLLPFLTFGLISCEDKDVVKSMDLRLFDGYWEVVDEGYQKVFNRGCILNISTSPDLINGSYGGYQGSITTFFLTAQDYPLYDKVYGWRIREVDDYIPLLDLVWQGDLDSYALNDDSEDLWEGSYFYKITKLTDTHMWWQANTNGDKSTIKFKRRTDIPSSPESSN